jgi:hypothetical protein
MLFSAPMMRANMAGIKTQTRRAIKPQPSEHHWSAIPGYQLRVTETCRMADGRLGIRFAHSIPQNREFDWDDWTSCPYGAGGDRMWARETHARAGCKSNCGHLGCHTIYRANEKAALGAYGAVKWTPAIHMPRWASRFETDIVDVRAEPLHNISEADAISEGVTFDGKRWNVENIVTTPISAVDAYRSLWEWVNGRDSWALNPWVWVIEYKRVIQ